mgnify:CR=1 FL=1
METIGIEQRNNRPLLFAVFIIYIYVGYYYQQIGCKYLTIGKKIQIPDMGAENELDILIEREGRVIVVECKNIKRAIDDKFVTTWLNKNIPQIRRWLIVTYPQIKTFEIQLWSLGGFTGKALEMLKNEAQKVRKYEINFYGTKQIIEMARKNNIQIIIEMLNQHLKPPLDSLEIN